MKFKGKKTVFRQKEILQELKRIHCISFSPVTGLAASFGSVPAKSGLKTMSAANFFKEAKAAAFRLRSPPAEEANELIS